MAALFELFVALPDAGVFKSKHLVVICVSEFMQHHPGLLVDLPGSGEISRLADMNTFGEFLGIAMLFQPDGARVVLHRAESTMRQIQDDGDGLQLFEAFPAYDKLN